MNMSEFFGFGGYSREAEGYMSWQHLTFVSLLTLIMVLLAVFIGRKYKDKSTKVSAEPTIIIILIEFDELALP